MRPATIPKVLLNPLNLSDLTDCRRCPRLVSWREEVAETKRAAYRDDEYWGRPVPGFGSLDAELTVVGLAPAAHGANRTGRMFTGDRSGDFLFASLHRTGFANQASSTHIDDGLVLENVYVTSPVKCAPPDNKPTTDEKANCRSWLVAEWELLQRAQVIVCLGRIAFLETWRLLAETGLDMPRPRPRFGHGAEVDLSKVGGPWIIGCYHPSQQNTFTGRLTPDMIDDVFKRATELIA
ncbi:MAG: uracil-DNA glycosylase [Acidimicrobiia bacterium]|nr:uracil-DNA glycosylase [Acidimicrobiia bacterium]